MARTATPRKFAASTTRQHSTMKNPTIMKHRTAEKPDSFSSDAITPASNVSRKRKYVDLTVEEDDYGMIPPQSTKMAEEKSPVEKRLRMFRKKAPQTFLEKLGRAQTQRMIVIGRRRGGTDDCPAQDIDIVGSTGNIYTVTIDKRPSCTCPDSQKGNECKHKVYALSTVLRAPYDLQYQLAFLSTELKSIFENAPPIPTDITEQEDKDGTRKPMEGECPICYMDLDEQNNQLVWCKAACGNNMHKNCFEQWATSQRGNTVKCVYCRTPWEMDSKDLEGIKNNGTINEDGYVNVAEHFGMSTGRDYSTYHPFWVRRTLGREW